MNENRVDPLRRSLCLGGSAALALGALAILAGGEIGNLLLAPALPPLHARCLAVMQLALALSLLAARRELDPAAARIPLLAFGTWALGAVAGPAGAWLTAANAGVTGAGAASATASGAVAANALGAHRSWLMVQTALGAAALWVSRPREHEAAPAQRPDLWLGAAAGAGALAAMLLWVAPTLAAAAWPWRATATQAALYAPASLAFALSAALTSRERRRYVRRPPLIGLAGLAAGVLATSLWHLAAFDPQRAASWLWFAFFAVLAAWVGRRLLR